MELINELTAAIAATADALNFLNPTLQTVLRSIIANAKAL